MFAQFIYYSSNDVQVYIVNGEKESSVLIATTDDVNAAVELCNLLNEKFKLNKSLK